MCAHTNVHLDQKQTKRAIATEAKCAAELMTKRPAWSMTALNQEWHGSDSQAQPAILSAYMTLRAGVFSIWVKKVA
jgi:hypothetical protein